MVSGALREAWANLNLWVCIGGVDENVHGSGGFLEETCSELDVVSVGLLSLRILLMPYSKIGTHDSVSYPSRSVRQWILCDCTLREEFSVYDRF